MMNPILQPILNNSKDASTTQTKNTKPASTRKGVKTIHRLKDGNTHRIARKNNTPINAIPNPILEIITNFFYSKVAGNFTF